MPNFFSYFMQSLSRTVSGDTIGIDFPLCIRSLTFVINFLPNFPAGWEEAKSFFVSLASSNAIAEHLQRLKHLSWTMLS